MATPGFRAPVAQERSSGQMLQLSHDAPLAVGAPVHEQAKFEVLPVFKAALDGGVGVGEIGLVLGLDGKNGKAQHEDYAYFQN